MKVQHIPFVETGHFSDLMCDYLTDKEALKPFHSGVPSFETLYRQAHKKKKVFKAEIRKTLCESLVRQYQGMELELLVAENLQKLRDQNTLTITTGHQLCLMTGPLYFIYKIVSAIKLSQQLNAKYPDLDFIPLYWMASEDHDFEEISAFIFRGKKFQWNAQGGGAVGRIDTQSLDALLSLFKQELGTHIHATALKEIIEKSYASGNNLSRATRIFVNALFEKYGLLILDADDQKLKEHFSPYILEELQQQSCSKKVNEQIVNLQKTYNSGFKPQVNPRDLNLFFFGRGKKTPIGFGKKRFWLGRQRGYRSYGPNDRMGRKISRKVFSKRPVASPLSGGHTSQYRLHRWGRRVGLLDAAQGFFSSQRGSFSLVDFAKCSLGRRAKNSQKNSQTQTRIKRFISEQKCINQ